MEKFEEELSCPVCLEMIQDPKLLACHHSFCQRCVEDVAAGGDMLLCPLCRFPTKLHDGVIGLRDDIFKKNIIELVKTQKKGEVKPAKPESTEKAVDLSVDDEPTRLLKNLKCIKDTLAWDDALTKSVWSHPTLKDEQDRGLVKMYLSIRRVYHGDDMFGFLVGTTMKDTTADGKAVILPANSYIASIARSSSVVLFQENNKTFVDAQKCFFIVFTLTHGMLILDLIDMTPEFSDTLELIQLTARRTKILKDVNKLTKLGFSVIIGPMLQFIELERRILELSEVNRF